MGPTRCPETSVKNCHFLLRKSPQERSSRLFRGGSLQSRKRQTLVYSKIDNAKCLRRRRNVSRHSDPEDSTGALVRVSRSGCSPIKASSKYNVPVTYVGSLSEVTQIHTGTTLTFAKSFISGSRLRSVSDK
jgi:hypothetical protein